MNFRRSNRREFFVQRLPLVAFLDVCFFLLLYFMMAGTLAPPEGELSAAISAERRGAGRGSDLQSQILNVEVVDGKVRYRVGERAMSGQADARALLEQLPKRPGIVVRVADSAPVSAAAAALQACRDAGFSKVSYVAGR
ncbi:MAG: biopolymer transporter ExbD [Luteimonas sp.]|nr:biopolymer transporter ExbD [Luteimonas sp.]